MRLRTPVGSIDKRRRMLEDAHARALGIGRQTERIIERIDVEGVRIMNGAEIARVRQRLAHPLGRPGLAFGADPAQPLGIVAHALVAVGLGNVQPAGQPDRRPACRSLRSRAAHSRRPASTAHRAAGCGRGRCARSSSRCLRGSRAARSRYCARRQPRPLARPPAPRPASRAWRSRARPSARQAPPRSRRRRYRARSSARRAPGLQPGSSHTSYRPWSRARSSSVSAAPGSIPASKRRVLPPGRAC